MPYVQTWDIAIDGGAHVGIFTRRMEDRFAHVYAFEPERDNFRCLAQNTTKARLFNCLLWHQPEMLSMKLTGHHNSGAGEIDLDQRGDVPALHLDALRLPSAGLIKLDVQDAESCVLMGAERLIRGSHPVLIVENTGRDEFLMPTLEQLNYRRVEKIRRDEIWVPN